MVGLLAEQGQVNPAKDLFRKWEPQTSFTDLGMELLKANRVIAAREMLNAAWEAGEAKTPLGLYLAYTEARTGYCARVREHLQPFIENGWQRVPAEDLSYFLFALGQCSLEPNLLPILVRVDEWLKPFPARENEVTALLSKAAAEQRNSQNLSTAWLLFQKVLQRAPDRIQDWPLAAETALELGLHSEAVTLLEGLLNRSPAPAVKEGIKGWLAEKQNDYETAAAHYQNSLGYEPQQPDLRFLLFKTLMHLKRFDQARAQSNWFRDKVQAGEVIFRGYLAETLSALGKPEEALIYWQELYLGNPDNVRYGIETVRALFALGRKDQALSLLNQLTTQFTDPRVFELAAEIWRALGRPEEVLRATQAGLTAPGRRPVQPQDVGGRAPVMEQSLSPQDILDQAEAAEVIKQPSLALEAARNWSASDPGNGSPYQIMITSLMNLEKYQEAEELLEDLRKRNPQFYPSLIHLRAIYSMQGQFDKAVEFSRENLRLRPWDTYAVLQHAISLSEAERFMAAYGRLRPLADMEIHHAVPVLIYNNVTHHPYPGRNTVAQIKEHLQWLTDQGYHLLTPLELETAVKKDRPSAMVVIAETETEPLLQIDALLEKVKGQAVLAVDFRALQTQVPFRPSPEVLSRLRKSGRWILAWSGPSGSELRSVVNEKGVRGNVLTHPLFSPKGRESLPTMEKRLEKMFSEAGAFFQKEKTRVFLYPGGDYGQNSLDTDAEAISVLQKVTARYFDYAVFADPNGYVTPGFDPLRLMGRNIPPSWNRQHLQTYLSQQHPLVRARLQLAKVLFWQGQHLQASRWFKKAEEAGADPWEINFHWGNNAYQYGDLPTAITKLRRADELNPDSPWGQDSLDRALWQKKFYLLPQGTYWQDSDQRSYREGGFDLAGHIRDGAFKVELFGHRLRWEREGYGSEKGTRLGLGGKWYFYPNHWLEGRFWNQKVDAQGNRWGGSLNLRLANPFWESFADLRASLRETIDTVEAVRADIVANRLGLYTYSRILDSFDCFADLAYTKRNDQNDTRLFNLRLVWRMKEWPYLGFGYAGRWADSDRKAVEYYAPKRLEQHQAYFNARGEYRLLHYRFSIQGGYAREEGTDWRFLWSTQLDLNLRITRRMELTGLYRHQESPLYDFDEFGLGFRFRF